MPGELSLTEFCVFLVRRRRQEGDASGGDAGRRRDMAGVRARPPGEAQQVRQVLVLVLLVRGGGGARPPRRQGDRRPRLGPVAQHPAREAHLEPHGTTTNELSIGIVVQQGSFILLSMDSDGCSL